MIARELTLSDLQEENNPRGVVRVFRLRWVKDDIEHRNMEKNFNFCLGSFLNA